MRFASLFLLLFRDNNLRLPVVNRNQKSKTARYRGGFGCGLVAFAAILAAFFGEFLRFFRVDAQALQAFADGHIKLDLRKIAFAVAGTIGFLVHNIFFMIIFLLPTFATCW